MGVPITVKVGNLKKIKFYLYSFKNLLYLCKKSQLIC